MKFRLVPFVLLVAGVLYGQEVPFERILNANKEPQNWLTYGGTLFNQRYSLLDQITIDNVKNLELQCRMFGVAYVPVPMPDYWLKDEEKLLVGQVSAVALHTPGHTPGSMSFHFPVDNLVLAGDTLFRGSIGRTRGNSSSASRVSCLFGPT